MTQCQARDCAREAITAIRTRAGRGAGLITTIWQDETEAPKVAMRYCGPCGVGLAANLTALTDGDLIVKVEVTHSGELDSGSDT